MGDAMINGDYGEAEELQEKYYDKACKALNGGYISKAMNDAISFPGTFTGGPLPLNLYDLAGYEINNKINSGIYGNNYPLNVNK